MVDDLGDELAPYAGPPARVLLGEGDVADYLCRHVERLAEPDEQQIQRWRVRIRKWASRGLLRRYGTGGRGSRRYDLEEAVPLARQWHADVRRVVDDGSLTMPHSLGRTVSTVD